MLASAGADGVVRMWAMSAVQQQHHHHQQQQCSVCKTLRGRSTTGAIFSLDWSANALAVAGESAEVCVWHNGPPSAAEQMRSAQERAEDDEILRANMGKMVLSDGAKKKLDT